jgi:hypothetical protein
MSYLPIQALNLNKAQINFINTTVSASMTLSLGTLISDTNDITKTSTDTLTLKSGKSYFIFVNLSHTKTNRTSYDIYIDGVSLGMCKVELESSTAFHGTGKSFFPSNGMGLVLNAATDKALTIKVSTYSGSDVIFFNEASTYIPDGAITIFYK